MEDEFFILEISPLPTPMPTELDALRANAERHAEVVEAYKVKLNNLQRQLIHVSADLQRANEAAGMFKRRNAEIRNELVQLASVVRNIKGSDDPGSVVYTAHLIEANAYAIDTPPADCDCDHED